MFSLNLMIIPRITQRVPQWLNPDSLFRAQNHRNKALGLCGLSCLIDETLTEPQ